MTGLIAMVGKLAPIVFVFAAGVYFARRGIIDASVSKAFSEFAFRFAIPAYLLVSLYRADLRRVFDVPALAAYTVTAAVGAIIVGGVACAGGRSARQGALRIMAACQVNTAYVAIPVFTLLFNDVTPIFPVVLLQVCVLTTVVITIMETAPAGADTAAGGVWRAVSAALTTPVVVACWAGIAANIADLPAPQWMVDSLSMAGTAASPVALFALGLHTGGTGMRLRSADSDEYWLIGVKCLGFPLLAYALARFGFHLTAPWLGYMVMIAAMPSPQNLFILAQAYDVDVDLAAAVVVKSTVLALLLLPVWATLISAGL
ncbi:AEC family transporter [Nocardia jejuensis]|uniref:AEC family transporter n=1 Tax=Nocardia jejuensis TaxID=328049 RepID=UPI001FE0C62B|nr:AEC family transporter [Nocardia jejuensis]